MDCKGTSQTSRYPLFQCGVGMFRLISALGRTFEVANSYGNLAVILQMILSGFVMTKTAIHPWWIWVSGSVWIWVMDLDLDLGVYG